MVGPVIDEVAGDSTPVRSMWSRWMLRANGDTTTKYGITSIPAIYLFQGVARVVKETVGAKTKSALLASSPSTWANLSKESREKPSVMFRETSPRLYIQLISTVKNYFCKI